MVAQYTLRKFVGNRFFLVKMDIRFDAILHFPHSFHQFKKISLNAPMLFVNTLISINLDFISNSDAHIMMLLYLGDKAKLGIHNA